MNFYNIIEEIEKVDPDFQDRISPRRAAIRNMTSFGSKVAVAALPFALGSMFKKAYGQATSADVIGVLNFALTLEFLESSFYNAAVSSSTLTIPSDDMTNYFKYIQADENKHVAFLIEAIKGAGGTPVPRSSLTFDYTGGNGSNAGPFADVFINYQTFLAVSETFEDTGVRAYKGQAPTLVLNPVLTAALGIHAVEARHASAIRYLRTTKYGASVNPWITSDGGKGNDTGIAAVDANYAGEDATTQLGVNILTLPGAAAGSTTSVGTATAAFDEPLTKDAVLKLLVGSFIVHH